MWVSLIEGILSDLGACLCVTDSSGESESSDDSDIEGEATSALFMVSGFVSVFSSQAYLWILLLSIFQTVSFPPVQKKRTPPKRGGGRGSAGSSRTGSRPGTPSIDSAATSNTLRAAASKLEQGAGKQHKASKS